MKNLVKLSFYLFVFLFLISCEEDAASETDINEVPVAVQKTWRCEESREGETESFYYDINIIDDSADKSKGYIINFFSMGTDKQVYFNYSDLKITIPEQTVHGNIISGTGTVDDGLDYIELTYQVDDGSGAITYKATLTEKQEAVKKIAQTK